MSDNEIALGERIRSKRQQQELTLDELAKRSGVARTTISKIERDVISPSFNTLAKIARGMNLKIAQVISEEQVEEQVLVKKKDRVTLERDAGKCIVEDLTTGLDNMQMEVVEVTIEGGCNMGVDPAHTGEEFMICLQGSVEFQIGDMHFKLDKGDALHFKPNKNTCLFNNGNRTAKVLWAHTPPRFSGLGR